MALRYEIGVLVAAVLISVNLLGHAEPQRIQLGANTLSVRQGVATHWSTATEDLKAVEVTAKSKRFGIIFRPKSVTFRKRDGDLCSLAFDAFDKQDMDALMRQ